MSPFQMQRVAQQLVGLVVHEWQQVETHSKAAVLDALKVSSCSLPVSQDGGTAC